MSQNRSSAVMQQRIEADDSLDDFPTPPWATRALVEHVLLKFIPPPKKLIGLAPCCNRGYMAKPMKEYFGAVWTSDVHDYGWEGQVQVADFLYPGYDPTDGAMPGVEYPIDLTFANPPYRLAQMFIEKALNISRLGCAMLVRTSFQEGGERYEQVYRDNPPTLIGQFAERVIMHKGVLRDPSRAYWDAEAIDPKTKKKACGKSPARRPVIAGWPG